LAPSNRFDPDIRPILAAITPEAVIHGLDDQEVPMRTSLFACLGLAMMFLVSAPQSATAQSSAAKSTDVTRQDDRVGQIFSDLEKRIIREVLEGTGVVDADEDAAEDSDGGKGKANKAGKGSGKGQKSGLPPGLAKRDRLPPGLQKQLDRNGSLPPGLDRRALPADLENRLPDRADSERVIVGTDVILIEKGTDLVLDVIRDVVRQKTGTSQ
jgi:hypothetical protein